MAAQMSTTFLCALAFGAGGVGILWLIDTVTKPAVAMLRSRHPMVDRRSS
jgi:hypothetical protein